MSRQVSRRRLLAGAGTLAAGSVLAGCADSKEQEGGGGTGNNEQTAEDEGTTDRQTAADGSIDDEETSDESKTEGDSIEKSDSTGDQSGEPLDLREANVVNVSFEKEGGEYTFTVELYHDDDGEDGYANWWQVERLDGTRLGRRDLSHAHSTAPFERSNREAYEVPEDVTCVVVRGHDQTHGYGGQAMLVDLESGETGAVRQDSDRQSFEERGCP